MPCTAVAAGGREPNMTRYGGTPVARVGVLLRVSWMDGSRWGQRATDCWWRVRRSKVAMVRIVAFNLAVRTGVRWGIAHLLNMVQATSISKSTRKFGPVISTHMMRSPKMTDDAIY